MPVDDEEQRAVGVMEQPLAEVEERGRGAASPGTLVRSF
jgi:hypothetical protein